MRHQQSQAKAVSDATESASTKVEEAQILAVGDDLNLDTHTHVSQLPIIYSSHDRIPETKPPRPQRGGFCSSVTDIKAKTRAHTRVMNKVFTMATPAQMEVLQKPWPRVDEAGWDYHNTQVEATAQAIEKTLLGHLATEEKALLANEELKKRYDAQESKRKGGFEGLAKRLSNLEHKIPVMEVIRAVRASRNKRRHTKALPHSFPQQQQL
jgi:hypothetical protein